jgi:hypothetical protein
MAVNDVAFQGTSVFYKIYASESAVTSAISDIENVNAQYSANGFTRITSLGYQELNSTARNDPLIPGSPGTTVVIRLFDEASYTARIHTNDTNATPTWGIPLRRSTGSGNGGGFNFFAATDAERDANPVPVSGDTDTSGATGSQTEWFVNAYAASVGRDVSYANLHSQLLHLGYIQISSN